MGPVVSIIKVAAFPSLSKKEPIFPLCSSNDSFLHKSSKRSYSRSGPDHDNGQIIIRRKRKMQRRLNVDRYRRPIFFGQMAKKMAGYAKSLFTAMVIA